MLANFKKTGWPKTMLVTGRQGTEKRDFIIKEIQQALFESRLHDRRSLVNIQELMLMDRHPDYYVFRDRNIAIGQDNSSAERGTIRHLLKHFIPYSPYESTIRFVFFENASKIRDQAESALLKVLEEPPKNTHFVLCSHTEHDLKETIRSRCLIVPFVKKSQEAQVPSETWDRFWFFSGQTESPEYNLIYQKGWSEQIKKLYDHFNYTKQDFLIFDSLGPVHVKQQFPKITAEEQIKIVILNLLPLYFSLRDKLFEGKSPTIGPIHLPKMELIYCYTALFHLRKLLLALRKKYFDTRSVNPLGIYYEFMSKLPNFWVFEAA